MEPINITLKQVFLSYRHCLGFSEVPDVWVSLPETPIPGALFAGEFFLPTEKRPAFNGSTHRFFVKDIEHCFEDSVQKVIVLLAIAPRSLLGVPSKRN